jgi:hypothetical protein
MFDLDFTIICDRILRYLQKGVALKLTSGVNKGSKYPHTKYQRIFLEL